MTDPTTTQDRIRQAWVNADPDEAATLLRDHDMDPVRFRAIIEGTQRPSSLDLAIMATAFRVTVGWLLGQPPPTPHEPVIYRPAGDSRHTTPAEICDTCSDVDAGKLVPASFCEQAKAKLPTEPGL